MTASDNFDLSALKGEIARSQAADGEALIAHWKDCFGRAVLAGEALLNADVPVRELIVEEWFKQGDLGFLFAPRGMGKTWLAMQLALCVAEGRAFGLWSVPKSRSVLYVDGEMAMDSTKARHASLSHSPGKLSYLHHEQLFHRCGEVLNLSHQSTQQALLHHCLANGVEVLFLDNLSCLFSGIKENDADSWELVLPWLLELRRNKIAVVIIHHAGRNGAMRGTSRREDAAFWILQLTEAKADSALGPGTNFVARFIKNRNCTEDAAPPMQWHFGQKDDGKAAVSIKKLSTIDVFRQWVEDGLTHASDIAQEMGISKGQVSKLAKRGIDQGWLKKDGREYALV